MLGRSEKKTEMEETHSLYLEIIFILEKKKKSSSKFCPINRAFFPPYGIHELLALQRKWPVLLLHPHNREVRADMLADRRAKYHMLWKLRPPSPAMRAGRTEGKQVKPVLLIGSSSPQFPPLGHSPTSPSVRRTSSNSAETHMTCA